MIKVTEDKKQEILEALDDCHVYYLEADDHEDVTDYADYLTLGDYCNGATKLVYLMHEEDNFVLKIPFQGECGDYFNQANEESPWDYCLTEQLIYDSAKENGIEKGFAETQYLGTFNDYPAYIQEKAVSLSEMDESITISSNRTPEEMERLVASYDLDITLEDCDPEWICSIVDNYGEDYLVKLNDFITDNRINDLHRGNYGYLKENYLPVLIDYGGYRE